MRATRLFALTLGAVVLAALAATRLSFNVDPLDLLPPDLREVQGLRELTGRFSGDGELALTLDAPASAPESVSAWAGALARHLAERGALAERVEWLPVWESDPAGAAELPAYLWLNGEPGRVRELATRLAEGNSENALAEALDELQFGFDGEALAFKAYDPFGLLSPPGTELDLGVGDGRFGSADGTFRVLYLTPPEMARGGYKEAAAWVDTLRDEIARFRENAAWPPEVEIGFTGEPAFEAEIGTGMEGDMTGSVIGAMALIHLLFFLMHRRLLPLVVMFLSLSIVLSLTVLASSFWIGKLSVMSVGFAAILVGLTVDYGVVLYQESRGGVGSAGPLRRAVGSGIRWAALTTAAVFASLGLSALPGIRELGLLVASGILIGAVVMLRLFAPAAAVLGAKNPLPAAPAVRAGGAGDRRAIVATLLILVAVGITLAVRGLPGFYASFDSLRPSESPADDAYWRMSERLVDDGGEGVPVIVRADDYEALSARSAEVAAKAETLVAGGALRSSAFLPDLVPSVERQSANVGVLDGVLDEQRRLLTELDRDFGPEAAALLNSVFGAWRRMLEPRVLPMRPTGEAAGRTFARAISTDGDGVAALGLLRLAPDSWREVREAFAGDTDVYLTGWPTLGPAVKPLVLTDVRRVFVPMAGVLVLMLVVVFRRPREIGLAAGVLVLSGIVLLAVMRLAGWEWDFLNVCASPLLLGTGIDYTVHMIGALRRHRGDRTAVRRGIARALLFCGASTAVGFGSLALADNAGLASLGRVCACGTLTTMAVAVFLLPPWWRKLDTRTADS